MEQTRADRVKELSEKLEQGIQEVFTSGQYEAYLSAMSKFHSYSFGNCMLIFMQFPSASRVAGFHTWTKEFRRKIKPGARAIRILAPVIKKREEVPENTEQDDQKKNVVVGYRAVCVFDISQTEGEELPSLGVSELSGDVEKFPEIYDRLTKLSPVPVTQKEIPRDDAKGYYSYVEQEIVLRPGMSESQQIKTLVHEIAHAKLHDEDEASKKGKREKEVEAESVAYVVCQHLGLDTSDYSFGYLAGWSSGKSLDELKNSLETIRATAAEIIDAVDPPERKEPEKTPQKKQKRKRAYAR